MNTLESWLAEGPFTLALSSSFFGFYAHCGVAAALYERGYRPQKITGSSAGALVGAALASGMMPDDFRELIFSKKKEDYWDPKLGLGVLAGQKFLKMMETHFVSEFSKTHIPLEVAVLDLLSMKTLFLIFFSLPPAVLASCAVPGMFHPVRIGERYYIDGGVFNKTGINYDNGSERILNIFIESYGLTGIYERKTSFNNLKDQHLVLRFANTPNVNFRDLATGIHAYQDTYKRAQELFSMPISGKILSAA